MLEQLGRLTALQSLSIAREEVDLHASEHAIINALAGQLTHLRLEHNYSSSHFPEGLKLHPCTPLKHLHLPYVVADDEDLELLLDMPHLTHLLLNVHLEESFVGWPCKWEELTCSCLDVFTLAYLPLYSGLLLKMESFPDEVGLLMLEQSATAIEAAIANVAKCKGLVWSNNSMVRIGAMLTGNVAAPLPGNMLVKAFPLLTSIRVLQLCMIDLTAPVMQDIASLMRARKDFQQLHLCYCEWNAKDLINLVPALPAGSTLELQATCESFIQQLCCAARHKLTLQVHSERPLPDGYMHRIMPAMLRCGHKHVTLVVLLYEPFDRSNDDT